MVIPGAGFSVPTPLSHGKAWTSLQNWSEFFLRAPASAASSPHLIVAGQFDTGEGWLAMLIFLGDTIRVASHSVVRQLGGFTNEFPIPHELVPYIEYTSPDTYSQSISRRSTVIEIRPSNGITSDFHNDATDLHRPGEEFDGTLIQPASSVPHLFALWQRVCQLSPRVFQKFGAIHG